MRSRPKPREHRRMIFRSHCIVLSTLIKRGLHCVAPVRERSSGGVTESIGCSFSCVPIRAGLAAR